MIGELPPDNNNGKKGADVINFEEALAKKRSGNDYSKKNRQDGKTKEILNESEKNKIICDLLDYKNAFFSDIKADVEEIISWLNEKEPIIASNYARFQLFLNQTDQFVERNFAKKEQNDFQRASELQGLIDFFSNSFFIARNRWEDIFKEHAHLLESARGEDELKQSVSVCLEKLKFNENYFNYTVDIQNKIKILKEFIAKNETD